MIFRDNKDWVYVLIFVVVILIGVAIAQDSGPPKDPDVVNECGVQAARVC